MYNLITLVHHDEGLEWDETRKLEYVGDETDVWDKIEPNLINLFDIESMVKHFMGYHNIVMISYLKLYKGMKLDLNICECRKTIW